MSRSSDLFHKAQTIIPGGVNSPVRAFKSVGGEPVFFKSGKGAYLVDVDDKHYIDYVGSWGPLILGHCHPNVIASVDYVLHSGMSFGAPTELEIQLAEKIASLMPSIEKIRMVNSGTEATMTAIRLARGFTNKNKFIKFNGCYHGHSDSLLVKAGSGLLTLGIPSTPGIPQSITEHTLTADFNNLEQVAQLFEKYPNDIATVILEPVPGNMGFILPRIEFLKGLRELCDQYNALLIFDEVMTGFRVGLHGAQGLFGIKPDITTLGKIIGGGMPVGALGGKREIMSFLAPEGPVYQAGTLSGNPLAMAAGLATLNEIEKVNFFENLSNTTSKLTKALAAAAENANIPFFTASLGGMFGFCFTDKNNVENYLDVASSDEILFKKFFHAMLNRGVYFAPSMYEAGFVSSAHGDLEIEKTYDAAELVLNQLKYT
ncbi:glutamate-1-semialdehyde 2,1-aminomutase [Legionella pneumophila]|uniref:Glutamate-1-semialdehyde 2,1-aminomutase n=1 Tax=Legionella pneumophila subsp. pascullei TaxID=91890 RepID=A0AAX2IWY8_LEGPN|nr:glutamate-1-semialdehyde 2,1-aminomutase [Legionella pneumophila]AMP89815.1 aspartate aminotransferase family protein [Legionella pneumophila subsp. pascullei]AMP92519.1 glutamate-1-semialdehyde aminotransferase [Legionella pneumophila subsp. pascullei]AMP95485.1 glutamate-1-semialdehyde aminotransferase [Legionella pneumophila subsp. pascullei]SQG90390.1 glutamate-1-semialdehyde-2,1-aminomutase [Legionella pneumophila subsp. pascullei]VEH06612.1 glutamate-1-semialdehyde-2,1-aminomutase [Le